MGKIVIITGVSGSGKTTLQEELKKQGWYKPINYTTRKPRNDAELDDYVFCNKTQFITKLLNGDFLEMTTYGGELYGIPKFNMEGKDFAIILDPIGRAQVMKSFAEMGIKYSLIFLDISKEVLIKRLENRGDSIRDIEKRVLDLEWFKPTPNSIIIDGNTSTKTMVGIINQL